MRKIRQILRVRRHFLAILAVSIIVIVAYGQVGLMYFWQDDSALIFKLQHPQGAAGSYGEGIIGQGAYKYLVTPFVPFFTLFGLNPFGYYSMGVLAYGMATFMFYFFSKEVLQSSRGGFFSTLIFAAGYIGSDTMFRFGNSWQTNFGIIFALLSLLFLCKYLRLKQDFKYYFLSLGLFFIAVEFIYIRSHSLIFPVLALDFLLTMVPLKLSRVPGLILRQIPFWAIFYIWYIRGGTMGSAGLGLMLKELVSGKIEILASFFATIGNSLVPNILQTNFIVFFQPREKIILLLLTMILLWLLFIFSEAGRKLRVIGLFFLPIAFLLNRFFASKNMFWYRTQEEIFAGSVGLYLLIIIFCVGLALWKNRKLIAVALMLGLLILTSQIFGYYIQYPKAIFGTTHRYLSHGFIGYSLIFGSLALIFFEAVQAAKIFPVKYRNYLAILPLGMLLMTNLSFGVTYQNKILMERSQPTREFYTELTRFVPSIEKGATFYFDVAPDSRISRQFNDFFSVGSMPNQTALAIYYNVDRYDLSMVTDFDELLFKLSKGEIKGDNIYSFYYGENGLVNTTDSLRGVLKNGSEPKFLQIKRDPPAVLLEGSSITPVSPLLLTFTAQLSPDVEKINSSVLNTGQRSNLTTQEKEKAISYLLSRLNYFKTVLATSLSSWRFQEIQNIADNNLNTSWRGNRIYWHSNQHDQVVLDLGTLKEINKLIWTNWNHTLTPTIYTIDVSSNKTDWTTVKKVENGGEKKDGEKVVEVFKNSLARYVRMDITGTLANDAPAVSEMEVIESLYTDSDLVIADNFTGDPSSFIKTTQDLNLIFNKVGPLLNLRVEVETDDGTKTTEAPIGVFNMWSAYELVVNTSGTVVKGIKVFAPDLPLKLDIQSAQIRNLSFKEIKNRGLIKQFIKN